MRECALRQPSETDVEWQREEVWSDDLWRLTMSIGPGGTVPGFSYLEPRRHIPHLTDLAYFPEEAATFGVVIGRCADALKVAVDADLVFVYIFGGHIPHLHVHLAPHRPGDALNSAMIKGEVEERPLASGAVALISKDYPQIDVAVLKSAAERTRALLTGGAAPVVA